MLGKLTFVPESSVVNRELSDPVLNVDHRVDVQVVVSESGVLDSDRLAR